MVVVLKTCPHKPPTSTCTARPLQKPLKEHKTVPQVMIQPTKAKDPSLICRVTPDWAWSTEVPLANPEELKDASPRSTVSTPSHILTIFLAERLTSIMQLVLMLWLLSIWNVRLVGDRCQRLLQSSVIISQTATYGNFVFSVCLRPFFFFLVSLPLFLVLNTSCVSHDLTSNYCITRVILRIHSRSD